MNEQDQKILDCFEQLENEYQDNQDILINKVDELIKKMIIGIIVNYEVTGKLNQQVLTYINELIKIVEFLAKIN